MAKKRQLTEQEKNILRQAMVGTKPLTHRKKRTKLLPAVSAQAKFKTPQTNKKHEDFKFDESESLEMVDGEKSISYKQASISNKTLRKLQKGQYNIEGILDLHGMTIEQALKATNSFLQTCLHEHILAVLIIHGKGHHSELPQLKNKLNHWLRKIDVVLAFCSALPRQGGNGALYLLLKRTTEENYF